MLQYALSLSIVACIAALQVAAYALPTAPPSASIPLICASNAAWQTSSKAKKAAKSKKKRRTVASVSTATVARAGTPVAVPDDSISAEMKEFADVSELTSAISRREPETTSLDNTGFSVISERGSRNDVEEPLDVFIAYNPPATIDEHDLISRATKLYKTSKAYSDRVEGTVIVSFVVETNGRVSNVRVFGSSGSVELDEIAKKASASLVYTPGRMEDGRPVAVRMQRPITFRMR